MKGRVDLSWQGLFKSLPFDLLRFIDGAGAGSHGSWCASLSVALGGRALPKLPAILPVL